MTESQKYLRHIAERVTKYAEAKQQAVDYLVRNKVQNKMHIENCLIFSQIWCAHHLNENITMNDLVIYLGNVNSEPEDVDDIELFLDEDFQELTLPECLEKLLEIS